MPPQKYKKIEGNLALQKYEARRNMERFYNALHHAKSNRDVRRWKEPNKNPEWRVTNGRGVLREKEINMDNEKLSKKIYYIKTLDRAAATYEFAPGWRIGRGGTVPVIDCYPSTRFNAVQFAALHGLNEKMKKRMKQIASDDAKLQEHINSLKSEYCMKDQVKLYYERRKFISSGKIRTPATALHLGLLEDMKKNIERREKNRNKHTTSTAAETTATTTAAAVGPKKVSIGGAGDLPRLYYRGNQSSQDIENGKDHNGDNEEENVENNNKVKSLLAGSGGRDKRPVSASAIAKKRPSSGNALARSKEVLSRFEQPVWDPSTNQGISMPGYVSTYGKLLSLQSLAVTMEQKQTEINNKLKKIRPRSANATTGSHRYEFSSTGYPPTTQPPQVSPLDPLTEQLFEFQARPQPQFSNRPHSAAMEKTLSRPLGLGLGLGSGGALSKSKSRSDLLGGSHTKGKGMDMSEKPLQPLSYGVYANTDMLTHMPSQRERERERERERGGEKGLEVKASQSSPMKPKWSIRSPTGSSTVSDPLTKGLLERGPWDEDGDVDGDDEANKEGLEAERRMMADAVARLNAELGVDEVDGEQEGGDGGMEGGEGLEGGEMIDDMIEDGGELRERRVVMCECIVPSYTQSLARPAGRPLSASSSPKGKQERSQLKATTTMFSLRISDVGAMLPMEVDVEDDDFERGKGEGKEEGKEEENQAEIMKLHDKEEMKESKQTEGKTKLMLVPTTTGLLIEATSLDAGEEAEVGFSVQSTPAASVFIPFAHVRATVIASRHRALIQTLKKIECIGMGEGGGGEDNAVGVGLYECLSDNIDASEEEQLCAIMMSHVRIEVGDGDGEGKGEGQGQGHGQGEGEGDGSGVRIVILL